MNEIVVPSAAATLLGGPLRPDAPALDALFDTIAAGSAQREYERILPHEPLGLIRSTKLGALRLPVEAGGAGVSFRELFGVVLRLATADANVAHILRNHFTFVERYARTPRNAAEEGWRRAVAEGAIVGLANTESDAKVVGGSPFATVLRPDGDGWRISGRKYYSTGTIFSDLVLVRVATPEGGNASLILPVKREGIEIVDDWDGIGQRLTGSGTTIFNDVRVEPDEVVPDGTSVGYGTAYSSTLPQLYLTTVNAGILAAVLRDATALLKSRKHTYFFAPTAVATEDPILQQALGEISAAAYAAEALVLATADALDAADALRASGASSEEVNAAAHGAALKAARAKVIIDDLTLRSASQLFDVGGASAAHRAVNLDRHWRNARTLASHNPRSYKARLLGLHAIDGTPLPPSSFF
ncbi:acyl-CoA dehydrogenase family protein [Xanthobacter agilis]|uniref:Alkylation response protein AidB-like acyl-CoA dehydrogenase n=1 Tax=Xanthobacter agilis TaxID=47492 RepID=A0ABU0LI94_XANAG|nr:acyl-CoA dehydrogenase [Xanthobacter agilis]MDQ0506855.1 alkylation response protein AidB-like acyl-CoA dehydrogenase [Xanthobacter agilis]